MSRLTVAVVCSILLGQALVHGLLTRADELGGGPAGSGPTRLAGEQAREQQERQQQQQVQSKRQEQERRADIDLTELTPRLEQQLRQAKRLSRHELADDPRLLEEAYRYELLGADNEVAAGGAAGRAGQWPLVQAGNWFDRLHLANKLKLRRGAGPRHSRGLPSYYRTSGEEREEGEAGLGARPAALPPAPPPPPPVLYDDQKEDKAYEFVGLPSPQSIDNHESASRDSLWTSSLLRDLLIAQEAANRVRRVDQLTRAALGARQRGPAKINKSVRQADGDGGGGDGGPNGIEILETREKKRRCKVDPNLGVKNPSFCDTDAYFGAADYSMRDVWDSAGR